MLTESLSYDKSRRLFDHSAACVVMSFLLVDQLMVDQHDPAVVPLTASQVTSSIFDAFEHVDNLHDMYRVETGG
jgi:hypothetical protein